MDVQQDQRISKLLPTVKCSDCGVTVEFRKLGEHLCSVPAVPELPAAYKNSNIKIGKEVPGQKIQPNLTPLLVDNNFSYNSIPSPTDSEHSNYSNYSNKFANPTINPEKSKPARSFLQKYQQVTGKPINSPSFQPPLTPSSDRGYSDMPDLQDRQVNNPNGNGVYYKDAGNMMQKNQVYGNGYQNDRERQHVRPYDQGHGKPPFENTKHPYRNVDPYRANQMPPSNNYLNDNMERAQGKYYRNPNDGYTNGDYMRREEPRSRSRSPAPGYDRQNYPQMPPNNPYGAPQPLRQAPYDRYDGQLPYGHDNYRPQNPRMPPPPQEKSSDPSFPVRTQSPPSSYVSDNNNGSHKSNTTSFSSTGSSASGKYNQKHVDNGNSNNSKDSFGGGFDDLMEDLLREMDNMQAPSAQNKGNSEQKSNHSKNSSSSEKKGVPSDICAYCNLQVNSSPMRALGRSWHPHHLLCAKCKKPIDPNVGHVEREGKVYCPNDFTDLFFPKCRRCNLPVEREAISASDGKLEGKWHVKCFSCHTCSKEFPDGSFYVFDNAPYCKRHYHKLNNSLCGDCDEPIEGPCAETDEGWRYHPNCFVCTECRDPLTDAYYSFEEKHYCETHIMEIQRRRKIRAEKRQTLYRNI